MNTIKVITIAATAAGAGALVYQREVDPTDIPNRIPEAPPFVTVEAEVFPPPYEEYWRSQDHPGQCQTCHAKIFDQWNGSMMSNAWRDPVWRAAFLLLARSVSTNGECDTPQPPDGTRRAGHNPFAKVGACASEFDIGTGKYVVSRPGSLLDGFCSRCHMPANYVDNVPLHWVRVDAKTGAESGKIDPRFNPTADEGTGFAFATLDSQFRNTEPGKMGVFCAICHTFAATRDTPFHDYGRGGTEYYPAAGEQPRSDLLPPARQDMFAPADPARPNLGYSIGSGAYRLSPHAIVASERFGPLAATDPPAAVDTNTSQVFGRDVPFQHMDPSKHRGFHQAMFVRSEMCAACHDVTNALPIKNQLGRWVGGFPIERTYTEWASSRYADRPGNKNYDPRFKRDCQSCHMQQDYGQPGTAQTLYRNGAPLPAPEEPVALDGKTHPFFTHHFVGGNALVPRLIGKDIDRAGNVSPYPELSAYSFSSADPASKYSRGVWTNVESKGAYAQQARMAWDRLRHVLGMSLVTPAAGRAGESLPISITVANTGSGHDFPTGFPEGRTAWLAVHAYDLATGGELPVYDSVWSRTSIGVGNLTSREMIDPNFPGCGWRIPAGSADPYSIQFKAVASLGDGCPTLELPYAAPLNLVTNERGLPVDASRRVIDSDNSAGPPQYTDSNRNGDRFDDSYLRDTRLRPMPWPEATRSVDRYSVVVPPGTQGPIAVSSAVYYQSVEAVVAIKFLGNMADTDNDFRLEPCVLGGPCDGRKPTSEPAVVEGSPPVPVIVRSALVPLEGAPVDASPPTFRVYPAAQAHGVYPDVVVKVFASKPVHGLTGETFTLTDDRGERVPSWVDQIGDGTWGLFPSAILLEAGHTYTARLKAGIRDSLDNATTTDEVWRFTIAEDPKQATGDTSVPIGFSP